MKDHSKIASTVVIAAALIFALSRGYGHDLPGSFAAPAFPVELRLP
jgi:hypothetical protein